MPAITLPGRITSVAGLTPQTVKNRRNLVIASSRVTVTRGEIASSISRSGSSFSSAAASPFPIASITGSSVASIAFSRPFHFAVSSWTRFACFVLQAVPATTSTRTERASEVVVIALELTTAQVMAEAKRVLSKGAAGFGVIGMNLLGPDRGCGEPDRG